MRGDDFCSGFEEVYFKTYWGMVLESRNNWSVLEEKKLGMEQFGLEIRIQSGLHWPARGEGVARVLWDSPSAWQCPTGHCELPSAVQCSRDAGISVCGEVTPAWTDPLGETGLFVVLGNRRGELGRTWQEGDMVS